VASVDDDRAYLNGLSQHPDRPGDTSNMNPAFASSLAAALRQANAAGLHLGVMSGYRDDKTTGSSYDAGGNSSHGYGLASDISGLDGPNGPITKQWAAIAAANGLHNPYGVSNTKEFNHWQLPPLPLEQTPDLLNSLKTARASGDWNKVWAAAAPVTSGTQYAGPGVPGTKINYQNVSIAGPLAPVNDYYHTQMMHESGGQNIPNATGGWSAAGGYYQFTPSTYASVRSANPELNLPENIQDASLDQQTAAMKALTSQNVDALTKAGVPITDKNVALAHFLGPGGASNFYAQMSKNPGANAADLFPKEAAANPTVFNSKDGPRTLQQVYDLQTANHGTGNTTGFGPDAAPSTTPSAAAPAAAPADQSWAGQAWSKLTGAPTDAQGNPTNAPSPMEQLLSASNARLLKEGATPATEAPQDSSPAAAQFSNQRFAPGARNVSPGLANVQQTYGTTINAASQPLTWTDAPPGAPKLPAAGLRGPMYAQVPGVSLNSVQPPPQGLGYGVDPNIGYGYG
jgi:hypothetical protein